MPDHSPGVFISYARRTSSEAAQALWSALGGDQAAFLDTSDIDAGAEFPKAIVDALLGSKVVVVFADWQYFSRWYCLRELFVALAPSDAALGAGSPLDADLRHIVVALAPEADSDTLLRLPPLLRTTNWPRSTETVALAELVQERIADQRSSLGARLEAAGMLERVRSAFLEAAAVPQAARFDGIPAFPPSFGLSIGDAFVGRTDHLWRLDLELSAALDVTKGASAPIVSLEAMGGIGKTRLALEYVHRLAPLRFGGGVFWIDADTTQDDLEAQFHGIVQALSPGVPDLRTFREQGRNAAAELQRVTAARPSIPPILFVIDNLPEPRKGEAPLPVHTWCPALGRVAVLITSRHAVSGGAAAIKSLGLPALPAYAAVEMLTRSSNRGAIPDSDWHSLADWVGHLPLALELLNAALRLGALTPAELLEISRRTGTTEQLDRQMEELRSEIPAGSLRGITEAFNISYERLSDVSQEAARLLSRLGTAPIPTEILAALGDSPTRGEVRAQLTARSFLSPAPSIPTPTIGSIHRVLADFLRTRTLSLPEEANRVLEAMLAVSDVDQNFDTSNWPCLRFVMRHAVEMFRRIDELALAPDGAAKTISLLIRASQFLRLDGLTEQALALAIDAVAACEARLEAWEPTTIDAHVVHGTALMARRDFKAAVPLLEKATWVSRRSFSDLAELTQTCQMELGTALRESGDPVRAACIHGGLYEYRRTVLGISERGTLVALHNFALDLLALGDLERAKELFEMDLELTQLDTRPTNLDRFASMRGLAMVLIEQKDLIGARHLLKSALNLESEALQEDHPNLLDTLGLLANVYQRMGDAHEANRLLELAASIAEQHFGVGSAEHEHYRGQLRGG